MTPSDLRVVIGQWSRDREHVRAVRQQVFVVEQGVPVELEVDGKDPECIHVVAFVGGVPVGTARMQKDGHIGRVAVLATFRLQGIGRRMVAQMAKAACARGLSQVYLHSQKSAAPFYSKLGFKEYGPQFIEADIPHIAMRLAPLPRQD